ncbi:MAG: hypothetical protein ABIY55_19485 [Kofleriaceae bacterium]
MTARSRAESAFERADYVAAAEEYDALARQSPDDASLRARRDDARAHALATRAGEVKRLRLAHQPEAALTKLAALLSRSHDWPDARSPETTRAITEEVDRAAAMIHDEIRRLLVAYQPLGAEVQLAARRKALDQPELAALWSALEAEVRELGVARCRTIAPADPGASPYLARLAAAYCAHVGVDLPPVVLPDRFGGLTLDGAVAGMTDEQRTRLVATLQERLTQTPWFTPGGAQARVALAGHQAVAYGSAKVQRAAPWSESVQYMAHESYQEPYQESYQESYSVQVPYTEYRTESYSCGSGTNHSTCSRSVSSTSSRSEMRSRTAYRTAYRTASRSVMRTRSEARVFTYAATERSSNFTGAWNLAITLSATAPPLAIQIADTSREASDDHDVTFPAAQVAPSRAKLPSFDDWFDRLLAKLRTAFPAQFAAHWSAAFCQRPSFDAEAAARCAYGAALPAQARAALSAFFHGDVDQAIARYAARENRAAAAH